MSTGFWYGASDPPPTWLIEMAEDAESRTPEVYAVRAGVERGPLVPTLDGLRQRLSSTAIEFAVEPASVPLLVAPRLTIGSEGSASHAAHEGFAALASWLAESLQPDTGAPLRIVEHRFDALSLRIWRQLVRHRVAGYNRPGELHLVQTIVECLHHAEDARALDRGPWTLLQALLCHELVEMALLAEGADPRAAHEVATSFEQCCVEDELAVTVGAFFDGLDAEVSAAKDTSRAPAAQRPATVQAGPQVLVVDDAQLARYAICTILKQLALEPLEAADGAEALERLESADPQLIILDLSMPGLDGLATLRRLREQQGDNMTPVIVVSASSNDNDVRSALELGASNYLVKPVDRPKLTAAIREVLGAAISPETGSSHGG